MDDLCRLMQRPDRQHFFGSVVADVRAQGGRHDYYLVDGQQRLTTVSLLLLAMRDLLKEGRATSAMPQRAEQIDQTYLLDRFVPAAERIRLRPVDDDRLAYDQLVCPAADQPAPALAQSRLMQNYRYLQALIVDRALDVDRLFDALNRLDIILITLEERDDAQEIFESLNSTGLDLTEGDKIRNYLLMNLAPQAQQHVYNHYWTPIERRTHGHLDDFVRDYLSVKTATIPNIKQVYPAFKAYARRLEQSAADATAATAADAATVPPASSPSSSPMPEGLLHYSVGQRPTFMGTHGLAESLSHPAAPPHEELIQALAADLLSYAQLYETLLTGQSQLPPSVSPAVRRQVDASLRRIEQLHVTVARPFLLEVLRQMRDGDVSAPDGLRVLLTVECLLFRRIACGVPSNALNKIFLRLNGEILRLDGTPDRYPQKLAHLLRSYGGKSRLPHDDEFIDALTTRNIYGMNREQKAYLFERLENEDTLEAHDVYARLFDGTYTIEHIMPQKLSAEWTQQLGPDAQQIHTLWLDRLANLTLSAYNPHLSNRPFAQKRDDPDSGYRASGLRMNQRIAQAPTWGPQQLQDRTDHLARQALQLWPLPTTDGYLPPSALLPTYTLSDESIDYTGRTLVRYRFRHVDHPASSWRQMYKEMLQALYTLHPDTFRALAQDDSHNNPACSFVTTPTWLRASLRLDTDLYAELNHSARSLTLLLRQVLLACHEDPDDLLITLTPAADDSGQGDDV